MEASEKPHPKRLYHTVPPWVREGALFHIRIRVASLQPIPLTEPALATRLIAAAQHYHEHQRWFCRLFLLMPDHLHALLAFPMTAQMSRVIGDWKRFTAQNSGILWQSNYFDHRLRDDRKSTETYAYIQRNPLARRLCAEDQPWPWQWSGEDT